MRFETQEALLIWLIGHFGETFHHHAILKGGMVLRLLDSPRSTNDVDFVFVPYASRKEIRDQVRESLDGIEGIVWSDRVDSRAWRILVKHGGQNAQVEITVSESCASFPISTGPLARAHGLPGKVVRVVDLPVALSNKLAAWNERRLWRDVHDLWFLHSVKGVRLDLPTLDARLDRVVPRRGRPRSMMRSELVQELRNAAVAIDPVAMAQELADTIPREDLVGMDARLSTALSRLAYELEASPDAPAVAGGAS